jgi:hypothetical protein
MLKHPNGEKIPAGVMEDRLELLPGVATAVLAVEDDGLAAILVGDLDPARVEAMLVGFNAAQPHRYLRLHAAHLIPAGAVVGGHTGSFKKARGAYFDALAERRAAGDLASLRLVP